MEAIEKNIIVGMNKIPTEAKEKMIEEENRKKRIDLKHAKEDLWKLRNKEKKVVKETTIQRIQEMGKKAEKIAEILEKEKRTIEEEKRMKEMTERTRKNAERNRKERLEKKEKLQEKWALYR